MNIDSQTQTWLQKELLPTCTTWFWHKKNRSINCSS